MTTTILVSLSAGVGMGAGYIRGKSAERKLAMNAFSKFTQTMTKIMGQLVDGAIDVICEKGGVSKDEAVKILMVAAGKNGFAGAMLNTQSGEIFNVDKTEQK